MKRDDEVVGFLLELSDMHVGVIVSNGFPCAYTMTNMKTMSQHAKPYADEAFFSKPGFTSLYRYDPVYSHTNPRDFFNFFGAADGDDGESQKPGACTCGGND